MKVAVKVYLLQANLETELIKQLHTMARLSSQYSNNFNIQYVHCISLPYFFISFLYLFILLLYFFLFLPIN